jgi:hypothetical protein
VLGVATTTTLRRHIGKLEQTTTARFAAAGASDKLRRFNRLRKNPEGSSVFLASGSLNGLEEAKLGRSCCPIRPKSRRRT